MGGGGEGTKSLSFGLFCRCGGPAYWALGGTVEWRERGLVEAGGEGGWKERGEDFRAGRGERREIGCIIIILVATFLHYQVYYTYYIIHTCISIDIEQSASLTFSVAVFRAGQSSDVLT